ncbi:PAZ domain-containing protein [Tanacetum coccineum]|uniref:PAZ domain-containing protein n=1 Tax=Tanacetum coccineum TaxID=301880 RepID=A0ABQ5ESH9_9ASTR
MFGHSGQTAEPPPVNDGGVPVKEFHKMSLVTPASSLMVPLVPSAAKKLRTLARDGFGSVGKRVTIAPEVTSKTKSRDIMKFLSDSYGDSHLGNLLLAYDGKKSAFAAGPLPFDSKEFVVNLTEQNGREREFKVTIKFAARKELDHLRQFLAGRQQDNPQETIQALDVVLRESASKDREIVGRSLFHTDFGRGPLGDGIEYWKGFYQSLRPTQMGLSLNIDMSARAFYEPKLLSEFVGEFLQREMSRPLSDQERIKVKRALKGVRVEVRLRITRDGIRSSFIDETGATKTVVQYFREKYNMKLHFPALPTVQAGTDAKPTYLPMECCKPQNIMKMSNQYFENVTLKINVKVGGRNTILSATLDGRLPYVTDRPTIIFGVDVTHPQPGEDSSPSIAAVDLVHYALEGLPNKYDQVCGYMHHKDVFPDLKTAPIHVDHEGTSRPTHYHVLYDENKFTADGLQTLTNSLCYTYATRSVSIAYNAHLAAFRARSYMDGDQSDSSSYSLKLNGRRVTQFIRACQRPKDRDESINNTMRHNEYNKDPLASKDFEMNVTELLTSIEARVLPPPPLRYHESGRSCEVNPSLGRWNKIDMVTIAPEVTSKTKSRDIIKFLSGGGKRDTELSLQKDGKRLREDASVSSSRPIEVLLPRSVLGKLLERIDRQNLVLKAVKGDGNCEYRAVSRVIKGNQFEFKNVKSEVLQESGLYRVFNNFGKVKSASLTKKLGIAHVEMKEPGKMDDAVTALDGNEKIWYEDQDGRDCIGAEGWTPAMKLGLSFSDQEGSKGTLGHFIDQSIEDLVAIRLGTGVVIRISSGDEMVGARNDLERLETKRKDVEVFVAARLCGAKRTEMWLTWSQDLRLWRLYEPSYRLIAGCFRGWVHLVHKKRFPWYFLSCLLFMLVWWYVVTVVIVVVIWVVVVVAIVGVVGVVVGRNVPSINTKLSYSCASKEATHTLSATSCPDALPESMAGLLGGAVQMLMIFRRETSQRPTYIRTQLSERDPKTLV